MTRLTPDQLVNALRDEGVKVVKVAREGRAWPNNTTAGTFNPHGNMNHHTGSGAKDEDQITLLWKGRADLDGPLCHIGLGRDGTAYLVGWDNCNHAGSGDLDVLNAVLAERPAPVANQDNHDGNPDFWGIEVMNNGIGEPYPLVQLQALVKINTAICRVSGWTANSCIHHREWTNRKIDMSWKGPLRMYVTQALAMSPGAWKIPGLAPKPVVQKVTPKVWGPNVVAGLKAANRGLKYAMAAKKPGQVAKWQRVIKALKS